MNNDIILKEIKEILKLSERNLEENTYAKRENAGLRFLEETKCEVDETIEEYKKKNTVYLEDELGDIFWDYISTLKVLERDGYITNINNVFSHIIKKYSQRIGVLDKNDSLDKQVLLWNEVKKVQKKELAKDHKEKYSK